MPTADILMQYIENCEFYNLHKNDNMTPKCLFRILCEIMDFESEWGNAYRPFYVNPDIAETSA